LKERRTCGADKWPTRRSHEYEQVRLDGIFGIDRVVGDIDPMARLALIREAAPALPDDRAGRIQRIFSLPYDAGWERPRP
jgi:hypothetical protein